MNGIMRFAPSPTGSLHIGGARTVIFNKIIASKLGIPLALRIEDTDQTRYVPTAVEEILEMSDWLGIKYDLGPTANELLKLGVSQDKAEKYGLPMKHDWQSMVQSERKDIYKEHSDWLIDNGFAYRVFADELDTDMRFSEASKEMRLNEWRNASKFIQDQALGTGRPYHVRIKMPREGSILSKDKLRGVIKVEYRKLHDYVLLKTDGMPTYHLASVVDDHLMNVRIVLRNEEWLASLPLHNHLYKCFGWKLPEFVHTASILNPSGKGKMSKRQAQDSSGKTIPTHVKDYKALGFLPEAMWNVIAMTGWNPGDGTEYMSMEEIIRKFDINRINTTGAAWGWQKLLNMNQHYIKSLTDSDFVKYVMEYTK